MIIMLTIVVRWGYGLQDVMTELSSQRAGQGHARRQPDAQLTLMCGRRSVRSTAATSPKGPNVLDRIFGFTAPVLWAKKCCNVVIPQLLWLPTVRRNQILLLLISARHHCRHVARAFRDRRSPASNTITCRPTGAISSRPSGTGRRWPAPSASSSTLFFLFLRFVPIVSMAEVREIIEDERPR